MLAVNIEDRNLDFGANIGDYMESDELKKIVREKYGQLARTSSSCCGPNNQSSCCGNQSAGAISKNIGYSDEQLTSVPEGSNLGLGCGNPTAIASLQPGETVLDLGSGAGFDCFLAAKKVGFNGRVIGVDMTPDMIYRARQNARENGYGNVEFRLGELENLPVADSIVDAVISNCVINLVPDKQRVFSELYRVLKPGGRFFISDIVLKKELPEEIKNSVTAYVGCIAGAILKNDYLRIIEESGFVDVEVVNEQCYDIGNAENFEGAESANSNYKDAVLSITVKGRKR